MEDDSVCSFRQNQPVVSLCMEVRQLDPAGNESNNSETVLTNWWDSCYDNRTTVRPYFTPVSAKNVSQGKSLANVENF